MASIQLHVDRSKIDANFDSYKVSMNNLHFSSRKLEQSICVRTPSNEMLTLQHMKPFTNDNQLFCDYTETTENIHFLHRILESGNIQRLVYDATNRTWDDTFLGSINMGKKDNSAFPANLLFTERNLVVACNGIDEITVFLNVSSVNWVKMLEYKVAKDSGLSLIEARVLNNVLHVLAYQVEYANDKRTRSRVYSINVKLDDIDYAETLTVEKTTEFVQNGHFETGTYTNDGKILFLSSEKPSVDGGQSDAEEPATEYTWEQTGNSIDVSFKLTSDVAEEDVNIDLTKTRILLTVKGATFLNGQLFGEVNENDVQILADQKANTLTLKLTSLDSKRWESLIAMPTNTLQLLEDAEMKKAAEEDQIFGTDEPLEECDEADSALYIFWVDETTGRIEKQCDVSGSQVLFTRRDCLSPAIFCLRHDVDGLLWSFNSSIPCHVATLQAFGYVQASKTTRLWSGCSPNNSLACIVEGNNRILLYSQKVDIAGNLCNRKTSQKVSHVAKQHLLRLDSPDAIRGVQLADNRLFVITKEHIHVAELAL